MKVIELKKQLEDVPDDATVIFTNSGQRSVKRIMHIEESEYKSYIDPLTKERRKYLHLFGRKSKSSFMG